MTMNGLYRLFLLVTIFMFQECAPIHFMNTGTIRIKGSDTMRILTERWAEEYMKVQPNVAVYAEGGETGHGIQALIDGSADICAASRPLRANEIHLLAQRYKKLGILFLVAKDALSVYVNPRNNVKDLSSEQLKGIFTGEISNWKEVGGNDADIRVIVRSPNSGTYLYFKEHILDGLDYTDAAIASPTTNEVVQRVEYDPHAIGYGGIAYGPDITHCRIDGVLPIEANVRNDTYPIIRYLYLYTIDTPQGVIKDFIDWVLNDGQDVVKKVGYIPLWNDGD